MTLPTALLDFRAKFHDLMQKHTLAQQTCQEISENKLDGLFQDDFQQLGISKPLKKYRFKKHRKRIIRIVRAINSETLDPNTDFRKLRRRLGKISSIPKSTSMHAFIPFFADLRAYIDRYTVSMTSVLGNRNLIPLILQHLPNKGLALSGRVCRIWGMVIRDQPRLSNRITRERLLCEAFEKGIHINIRKRHRVLPPIALLQAENDLNKALYTANIRMDCDDIWNKKLLTNILAVHSKTNFDQTLKMAKRLQHSPYTKFDREAYVIFLVKSARRLVDVDPERALEITIKALIITETYTSNSMRAVILSNIAIVLSHLNEESATLIMSEAIDVAEETERSFPFLKGLILSIVGRKQVKLDLQKSIEMSYFIKDKTSLRQLLIKIALKQVQIDPQEAINTIRRSPKILKHDEDLAHIVAERAKIDFESAFEMTQEIRDEVNQEKALTSVAAEQARVDLTGAFLTVLDIKKPHWHSMALAKISIEQAKTDRDAALETMREAIAIAKTPSLAKKHTIVEVVTEQAKLDLQGAIQTAREITDGVDQVKAFTNIAANVGVR